MKSYSCKQAEPVELSSWLEYGMWFYVIWLWLCHPRFHPLPWFRVPSAHPFLGIPTDPTELFWSFLLPGWWGKKKNKNWLQPSAQELIDRTLKIAFMQVKLCICLETSQQEGKNPRACPYVPLLLRWTCLLWLPLTKQAWYICAVQGYSNPGLPAFV